MQTTRMIWSTLMAGQPSASTEATTASSTGGKCRNKNGPEPEFRLKSLRTPAVRQSSILVVFGMIHPQFVNLPGQRIPAPTQQHGSIPAAPAGVLQGHFNHDFLELRYGSIENRFLAPLQLLLCPVFQALLPGLAGGAVLAFRLVQELGWQI